MTGRYKIILNSWRTWEPEKRTAKRWSLFVNTCRLLANDGLNYEVTFSMEATISVQRARNGPPSPEGAILRLHGRYYLAGKLLVTFDR
jgi:hypothetical protein